MKKIIVLSSILLAIGLVYSCKKNLRDSPSGKEVYLDLPTNSYNYYDTFNSYSTQLNKTATLGRVLFYDGHLSANNSISCASCHKQELAFADNVALSRGFENRLTSRNSLGIQNLVSNDPTPLSGSMIANTTLFWDGRENSTKGLISRPITNHVEMGIDDMDKLTEKLSQLPYYKSLFMDAYGSERITVEGISDAISTFMCAITSTKSRFDQSINGNISLSAIELKGQALFSNVYKCSSCHQPQGFSYPGRIMLNIGLDYPTKDKGAGAVSGDPKEMGAFRIPNLRNVALTAPYMHDGRFATLEDVLNFYSHNIQNDPNLATPLRDKDGQPIQMNITAEDKKAIIAFLNTFTDYSITTDTKFSNPFKTK
ncbi:MAG: cytochrome c peroxidase [Bacteroidota bacterium]